MGSENSIAIWGAVLAGVSIFFSPFCLPLYPTYLAYLTGISSASLREEKKTWPVIRTTLVQGFCFLLGLSTFFYALGFSAGAASSWFQSFWGHNRVEIRIVGALVLIFMSLVMMGVLQPTWLYRMQRNVQSVNRPVGYLSSFLIGLGFSAGWSPCFVPLLSAVLAFIAQEPDQAFPYMTALSCGFGLPFLAFAFCLGWIRTLARYTPLIQRLGGIVMLVFGLLLLGDKMLWFNHAINFLLDRWNPGWISLGIALLVLWGSMKMNLFSAKGLRKTHRHIVHKVNQDSLSVGVLLTGTALLIFWILCALSVIVLFFSVGSWLGDFSSKMFS